MNFTYPKERNSETPKLMSMTHLASYKSITTPPDDEVLNLPFMFSHSALIDGSSESASGMQYAAKSYVEYALVYAIVHEVTFAVGLQLRLFDSSTVFGQASTQTP